MERLKLRKTTTHKKNYASNADLRSNCLTSSRQSSQNEASTERYCQSPVTDNKGVFSYHELMQSTPP